ncbi:MAG: acyltransferase [Thiomicrospira sp.]|uniref:acyltransferase family protein n=1 Tax=Thiomicrospira sp. TaxID=935 RepID=UPI0019EEE71F|nr:acyltransferase [Thiomicrospira sp.]MBE0493515.1 acyltransferase [Thiomicrospira sp.]
MAFWQIKSDFSQVMNASDHEHSAIDGLRALAILMVIAFHALYIAHVVLDKQAFVDLVVNLPFGLGLMISFDKAVDGFFVISGFLLASSLLQSQQRGQTLDFWRFYRKRLYRILPLFFIALALYASVAWKGDWYSLLLNLFFMENNFPEATKLIPVGWSLAIEMQFYLLLPILLVLSGRFLPQVLLFLLALALLIKFWVIFSDPNLHQVSVLAFLSAQVHPAILLDQVYYPTWMRFDPLIMGVLAAWFWVYARPQLQQYKSRLFHLGWLLVVVSFVYPDHRQVEVVYPILNGLGMALHRPAFALGISFLLLALLLPNSGGVLQGLKRGLSVRFWRSWSEMVFPLYLFHFPMLAIAAVAVFGTTDPKAVSQVHYWQVGLIFVLGAVLTWLFSLVLHLLVEKPFHRYGRA